MEVSQVKSPAFPIISIYPKEVKSPYNDAYAPMFITASVLEGNTVICDNMDEPRRY